MRDATVKCAAAMLAALGLAVAPAASAQAWPAKPVRMVVTFPPGGGLDAFARIVAPKLQELLGQQMVVENRVGAGGMVGADYVAKAAPDGYTALFASSAELTISQHLFPKMAYDPMKDLAPVSYASHAAAKKEVQKSPSQPVRRPCR